mmetsp:Transcript_34014/g.61367  ORF Transcript_34014/g.61367 Transcript_34014/m.61367 type:complete len:111 (-) Transcript_34014:155-487(-)
MTGFARANGLRKAAQCFRAGLNASSINHAKFVTSQIRIPTNFSAAVPQYTPVQSFSNIPTSFTSFAASAVDTGIDSASGASISTSDSGNSVEGSGDTIDSIMAQKDDADL